MELMNMNYFNSEVEAYGLVDTIANHLQGHKAVIGISGGKDSTVCAKLLADALGEENVYGVSMPNIYSSNDKELIMASKVISYLGINGMYVDIGSAYISLCSEISRNKNQNDNGKFFELSKDTTTNLPARLRMATLFAIAQSVHGRVINTCNLSEDMMGYSTLYGDMAGSYAPLRYYTVNEVIDIGKALGLPEEFIYKEPSDGLSGKTDEDNMGLKYKDIDTYIRFGTAPTTEIESAILQRFEDNYFKLEMINIPGPEPYQILSNYILGNCIDKNYIKD